MDIRVALGAGALNLFNIKGEIKKYRIIRECGRGASCIVYLGEYVPTTGEPIPVIIKECYPYELNLQREKSGELNSTHDSEELQKYVMSAEETFRRSVEVYNDEDLSNFVGIPDNIFYGNNTVYTIMRYLSGITLDKIEGLSYYSAIQITAHVSRIIDFIHKAGYLYLDIKPDNISIIVFLQTKKHLNWPLRSIPMLLHTLQLATILQALIVLRRSLSTVLLIRTITNITIILLYFICANFVKILTGHQISRILKTQH